MIFALKILLIGLAAFLVQGVENELPIGPPCERYLIFLTVRSFNMKYFSKISARFIVMADF
jgi:hypothetical protein